MHPEAFTPHAGTARNGAKCVLNKPINGAKGYFPRLTLGYYNMVSGYDVGLKVEFSAPKLCFGNNYEELSNGDYDHFVGCLYCRLADMGIKVEKAYLSNAEVIKIHYGKNILLDIPARFIIEKLAKLDVSKRIRSTKVNYANEGEQVTYQTKNFGLTFYDKAKELQKDKFTGVPRGQDILRIELRLNTKGEINKRSAEVEFDLKSTCLRGLFDMNIARRLLLRSWDVYIAPSQNIIALMEEEPSLLLHSIKSAGFKDARAMQIAAFAMIVEASSVRSFKEQLSKNSNYYARLKKDIDKIELRGGLIYRSFVCIRKDLVEQEKTLAKPLGNPCRGFRNESI